MPEKHEKKPGEEAPKNHIPKQVLAEPLKAAREEPARMATQEKPNVIVKQTPIPEIRIYGKTTPRKYTFGQKAADKVTKWAGSWWFIGSFFIFLFVWMAINVYMIVTVWDPYPFILLNLVLSCLAAIQAPVILMSQNRAADRDRAKAERDYAINRKSEREVELIKKDLDHIKKKLAEISTRLK
jgi:uncharacterized membrane protein